MDFKVKCVRYIKGGEKYFTVGKVYDVVNGVLTSDNGYEYNTWSDSYWEGRGNNFESLQKWFKGRLEFELVEEKKVFTKSDLKNGDVIVRRNGWVEIVIVDLNVLVTNNEGWNDLSDVREDLTDIDSEDDFDYDIVKVYRPREKHQCVFNKLGYTKGELVYDRERDTKKPLYNGKVVCIEVGINQNIYTLGKIYQFKDGVLTADNGSKSTDWGCTPFESFEQFTEYSASKFIEIKE